METWLPIPDFEGIYEVSDHGRVRSLDRAIPGPSRRFRKSVVLKPARAKSGHLKVTLSKDAVHFTRSIHRLVLDAFIGPCPRDMECCHNNGDPTDNRVENLRWDTAASNSQDCVRHRGRNWQTKKTHCPQGHEYTPETTDRYGGRRSCGTCRRDRIRRADYKRRDEARKKAIYLNK